MFKKYPSIENSYREQFMNYLELNGFTKSDFLYEVTEKVHGANFQIGFNGTEMMYGKRTDKLSETENFYN